MKLKHKGSLVVYNVPQEVGQKLVAAGLADEVVEKVIPPPAYGITWAVRDGARVEDFVYPPQIYAKCSVCAFPHWQESTKGTAHLTMQYRHKPGCAAVAVPGTVEQVPAHIAAEYEKRWAKYLSLSRNKKVVLPALTSTNTAEQDRGLMAAAGLKSREELILEAKKLAARAKKG
jgi:hypothetical protein